VRNPWERLPQVPPYVLAEDRPHIDEFNRTAREDVSIHLELFPEPFLGRSDAPVILLNLNPGFDELDRLAHHDRAEFVAACRDNLVHALVDYPLFLLNPALADSPGGRWWLQRLGPLIGECGLRAVAQRVLCVEYFPYHSKKFKALRTRLDSQLYGFQLVIAALKRRALVVAMRSEEKWLQAVPSLRGYDRLYRLDSRQNVTVSARNCPDGFRAIVESVT
jgi:hypothetical protein